MGTNNETLQERLEQEIKRQRGAKAPVTAETKRYFRALKKCRADAALPSGNLEINELCDILESDEVISLIASQGK